MAVRNFAPAGSSRTFKPAGSSDESTPVKTSAKVRTFSGASSSTRTFAAPSAHVRTFAASGASKSASKLGNGGNIVIYAAMSVLLTGGCILGYMAFQSNANTEEVSQTWSGIRNIANMSVDVNSSSSSSNSGNMDVLSGDDAIANALADFNSEDTDEDTEIGTAYVPNTETGEMEEVSAGNNSEGVTAVPSYYSSPMDRVINWDKIKGLNPQTTCWLYVPNSNIDYPVIQELKLGEYYYLTHDFYGNETSSGSIVTAALPEGSDTSAHFMILGHNMKNTTMFGTLRNYRNISFYKSNPYFYIYYPDRVEKWAVWSCYHTTDSDIIYDIPYELGSTAFTKLVKQINAQKSYETGINNTDGNKPVVTLSTCEKIDNTHRGRFVVNAVLAETKKY